MPPSQTEIQGHGQRHAVSPNLIFSSDNPFIRLYHGNCFELLDAIYAKYGDEGRFDCIFADPPYFLSNGGINSCEFQSSSGIFLEAGQQGFELLPARFQTRAHGELVQPINPPVNQRYHQEANAPG